MIEGFAEIKPAFLFLSLPFPSHFFFFFFLSMKYYDSKGFLFSLNASYLFRVLVSHPTVSLFYC